MLGNRDQVHSQISPSTRRMGKSIRIIQWTTRLNLAGWLSSLRRESTGCNQRSAYQIPTEEGYQGRGYGFYDLYFRPGVPVSPQGEINHCWFKLIINSSHLISFIFMMRPLLRKYSKISWRSLLSRGICQPDHTPICFTV